MALAPSTLFLANAVIEGILPALAALGKVQKAAKPQDADPDMMFALSTFGFCAVPSYLFWKDGQLAGHRSFGIGNAVYHLGAGIKLVYDRLTRPAGPESNVLAAIGALHLFMGYSFVKYVRSA